jgi:hypothetical protein
VLRPIICGFHRALGDVREQGVDHLPVAEAVQLDRSFVTRYSPDRLDSVPLLELHPLGLRYIARADRRQRKKPVCEARQRTGTSSIDSSNHCTRGWQLRDCRLRLVSGHRL